MAAAALFTSTVAVMDPRLRGDDGTVLSPRLHEPSAKHSLDSSNIMKTKSLPIGARSRRFVLELPLESPDGFGGVIRSYAPGPQVWGMMEMLSGAERTRADRPEQSLTHRITLRYREGVTGANRLTAGLRRFAIRAASDPDGSRRNLVCLVEEMKA